MKVGYLCADFGIPITGKKGASIHIQEFTATLKALGKDVFIVSVNDDAHTNELGVKIYAIIPSRIHLMPFEVKEMFYNFRFYNELKNIVKTEHPDILHERYSLFNYSGVKFAKKTRIPIVLEVNAPLIYERNTYGKLRFYHIAKRIEKKIFHGANAIVVVSAILKKYIMEIGVPEDKVHVVPNGVDISKFNPKINGDEIRKRYKLDKKIIVGFTGSLKPWHGVDSLIKIVQSTIKRNPDLHFLFVGTGPLEESLKQYVLTNNLMADVTFTGGLPFQDIPKYIGAMDIAVAPYPKLDNFYYSPIKIFEYMASGKPVIASKIGQIENIIEHNKTGILVEPGNIDELTDNILKLSCDNDLRKKLGENAFEKVKSEYTWEKNAERILDIYENILTKTNVKGGFYL